MNVMFQIMADDYLDLLITQRNRRLTAEEKQKLFSLIDHLDTLRNFEPTKNETFNRYFELYFKFRNEILATIEISEMYECLRVLEDQRWEIAKLRNFADMALENYDEDWYNECEKRLSELGSYAI